MISTKTFLVLGLMVAIPLFSVVAAYSYESRKDTEYVGSQKSASGFHGGQATDEKFHVGQPSVLGARSIETSVEYDGTSREIHGAFSEKHPAATYHGSVPSPNVYAAVSEVQGPHGGALPIIKYDLDSREDDGVHSVEAQAAAAFYQEGGPPHSNFEIDSREDDAIHAGGAHSGGVGSAGHQVSEFGLQGANPHHSSGPENYKGTSY